MRTHYIFLSATAQTSMQHDALSDMLIEHPLLHLHWIDSPISWQDIAIQAVRTMILKTITEYYKRTLKA